MSNAPEKGKMPEHYNITPAIDGYDGPPVRYILADLYDALVAKAKAGLNCEGIAGCRCFDALAAEIERQEKGERT